MVYDIPVKGDRVKPQQITALHLFCALAFIGSGAIIYVYNFRITYWGLALLLFGILLASVTIVRNKAVVKGTLNLYLRIAELIVSLSLVALSASEMWKFPLGIFSVLSAALVFSVIWERNTGHQLYLRVSESGITLPATFRRRSLPWRDVAQLVLRYGVISIDCYDNKLYQMETMGSAPVSVAELEQFCETQITIAKASRTDNDW